jgi:acyl-[acyl carrier protein]--UDP-N-acetylglucosamine O-acyltransferase
MKNLKKKTETLPTNWSLHYRNLYEPRIKRLTKRYRELYDENQMMKKRLEEYEGSKRMVLYYNKKEISK